MRTFQKITLSVLTISLYQHVYADTNTIEPTATLDTIFITAEAKTGTALGQKISEMPTVAQVISQQEISQQANGTRTVGDILGQLVPSLGTGSGSTSNYATTMRGRPVQYLLNGVPLTGSRNISRQLNSIDPTQLERVEVLSGATSIYGSGATGGLINLVTKSGNGENGLHGESRVGVSSNRTFEDESIGYNVGQSLSYANDTLYGQLDVDYEVKGGKFDSHDNRISPDVYQTDQQDTDTLSVNANLSVNITDTQSINLAATHYDNKQDTEYGPDYSPNIVGILTGVVKPSLTAVEGIKYDDQPYSKKNSVSLNYHNDDILGSNLNITGYYRDEKGRFYPSATAFTNQAIGYLVTNGVTDRATLGQLARLAAAVNQSEADIKVTGARAVMQTEANLARKESLFSYGIDFETEEDKQTYYGQDFNTYLGSNGLVATKDGNTYPGGPDTTVDKMGAFINADIDLTDKLHASAGVRYQNIKAQTEEFTPITEGLLAGYSKNPYVAGATGGSVYTAGKVAAGETEHSKTLFNLGTSYQINPDNQVFANFSQGFSIADVQRALRSVPAGFIVDSDNVQPITVNSYELGWQGNFENTNAKFTAFYNDSNKTVAFKPPQYLVEIVDTDERVYGAEASLSHDLNSEWTLGSTVAYTAGQFKTKDGEWQELDATRITPLKGTAFAQYNFINGSNIRLQALGVGGTDKAYQENGKSKPVVGYATLDLLGQVELPKGHVNYGIYNLLNKDYKTAYHQTTYGDLNRLDARGTTYGLSYTIDY